MTPIDGSVLLGAAGLIVLVNWYFLFSRRGAPAVRAQATDGGVQALTVRVAGGYSPAVVEVERGRLVRLTFDRQEENPCSEEVVLAPWGIRRFLPAHQQTTIEFTPAEAGRFEYTCGMSMLRGTIVVK
ncbi:MAG: cupredoxin domain-containing protein [Vicinamibacterales bacterium]|nr:cupredoxin domain-containing protein [Vicinamibacterales bacterium]